ncbi:MAG TPA: hypothetical protein VES42_28070 [Pilimelia sp.]|nr:hypothetical protein [Pilimelia sp.]
MRHPLRVPAGATHLVALGNGAGADQLRHAVKVDRVAAPTADPPSGAAWTRWLVWLGDARPPGAPSHLRFGRLRAGSPAGVLLPYADQHGRVVADPEATLTVTADAAGPAQVADAAGARWYEQPLYTGQPVADPSWRLAGWLAALHHRQVPAEGRGPAQTVLIVRPARTGTA